MSRISQRRDRRTAGQSALFALLPRPLLLHPPIAHRNGDRAHQITAFEFKVAVGLLLTAPSAWLEEIHTKSLRAGAKAIEAERELNQEFKQQWVRTNAMRKQQKKDWQRLPLKQRPTRPQLQKAPPTTASVRRRAGL